MKRGRRTLLNATLTKKICASLAAGDSIATACALSGVSKSSFFDWQRRGENGDEEFAEFSQSVMRARGKAKQRLVAIIVRQAPRDWKAAAWILERGFRDEYGKAWRGEPDLQPGPGEPTNVIVNVQRDAESDAAAKLFGERPANGDKNADSL
jgi:hypothetical protein